MMPTRSACTCDAYSVLSGLNGVWAAYPGRRRKPLFAAFTCALGFHTSARWGLRAHEIIGTFPCSRTGSPSASSKNMWGMTSVSTLGWDAAALWSHGPMVLLSHGPTVPAHGSAPEAPSTFGTLPTWFAYSAFSSFAHSRMRFIAGFLFGSSKAGSAAALSRVTRVGSTPILRWMAMETSIRGFHGSSSM